MKKIIILVLIIAIIFALLFVVISSIKKQPKPESSSVPQMSPQPTRLPTPFPSVTPTQSIGLKIVTVYPPELNNIATGTKIIVTFNQIIDTSTFKYTSNPPLEIVTNFVADNVIFRPKTDWPTDTKLTITIIYAKGDKGGILSNPYKIEFLSPAPTGL